MSSVQDDEYLSLDTMELQGLYNKAQSIADNFRMDGENPPDELRNAIKIANEGIKLKIHRLELLERIGWVLKSKSATYILPKHGTIPCINIEWEIELRERQLRVILKRLLAPSDSIYKNMDEDDGMGVEEVLNNE